MSWWRFIYKSLWYARRTHGAVLLAAAVGTAVLVGALAVGDSMRYSLGQSMVQRLGRTELALTVPHGFVTTDLGTALSKALDAKVAPVLFARGIVRDPSDEKRFINQVNIYGVDFRFFDLAEGGDPFDGQSGETIVFNDAVMAKLGAKVGDQWMLRLDKPEALSRDLVLVSQDNRSVASRLTVGAVAAPDQMGRFSLEANQAVALNVFVPLDWLGARMDRAGMANVLLVSDTTATEDQANEAIQACWDANDVGLEVVTLRSGRTYELRSRRVFFETTLSDILLESAQTSGVLTYFVNQLQANDKHTPYSMVTAVDGPSLGLPVLSSDDMVVTQWLADDLGLTVGQGVTVAYYVPGVQQRGLVERQKTFHVSQIIPMDHVAVDANLMPDFPGMSDVDNCRDWDTGVPVALDEIRDKDEDYWDLYRGSPKAFVNLAAGQVLWANQFGNLTAIRVAGSEEEAQAHVSGLLNTLDPAALGLYFNPVRALSEQALAQGTDFGPLFLGLSMFLIVGAMILTGLLFAFSIESRADQTGLLLALGVSGRSVMRVYLLEGVVLSVAGAVFGVGLGLLYARGLTLALNHLWQEAIASASVLFFASPKTCLIGAVSGIVTAVIAMALTLRGQRRLQARALLAGDTGTHQKPRRDRINLVTAVVALIGAVVMMAVPSQDSQAMAGLFFGAGALCLVFGLCLSDWLMGRLLKAWHGQTLSTRSLAVRNTTRRRSRSVAVICLLAVGVFVVVAVCANQRDPQATSLSRTSSTGGFAWIGQFSAGVLQNLNTPEGQDALGLDQTLLTDTAFVPMRVHDGDEASCLNLNRAQSPRLLSVDPNALADRNAFTFSKTLEPAEQPWLLLNLDLGANEVPVITDFSTLQWGLGKKLGDSLVYRDDQGQVFNARVVAVLAGSMLQGNLILAERQFTDRFKSEEGYRQVLIETDSNQIDIVGEHLEDRLQDLGLSITGSRQRLAALSQVENTYLKMFLALGGLGLALGSVGLALVVLRNLLDRRAEFAMLRAVGLDQDLIRRLAFYEHWGLLLAGLLWGTVAAAIAVLPAVSMPSVKVPYTSIFLLLAGMAAFGALWVWLAVQAALRGALMDSLRSE